MTGGPKLHFVTKFTASIRVFGQATKPFYRQELQSRIDLKKTRITSRRANTHQSISCIVKLSRVTINADSHAARDRAYNRAITFSAMTSGHGTELAQENLQPEV
jgi:DNA-binding response OmpR family regulator